LVPAILFLCVLLPVVLLAHLLRRHLEAGWWLRILMLPGAGALLIFLLMMSDAALRWARVPTTSKGMRAAFPDAETELRYRRASLAVADNLLNRLALALACLKYGHHGESAELFASLDAGECHDDPLILLGLARSQFGLQQFQAAKKSLDRLIAANPDFRSETGHLLYARTLEALGEVHDALHEYQTLTSYSRIPEAHCRFALLLTSLGRPSEAKALYRALLRALRRAPRQYARRNHQWIALAEREIAALAA
jgi:hypothetical protein